MTYTLQNQILASYRGWRSLHASVTSDYEARSVIIDDLSSKNPEIPSYRSKEDVKNDFEEFSRRLKLENTGKYHQYRVRKIDQTLAFLSDDNAFSLKDRIIRRGGIWGDVDMEVLSDLVRIREQLIKDLSGNRIFKNYSEEPIAADQVIATLQISTNKWKENLGFMELGYVPFDYSISEVSLDLAVRASVLRRSFSSHFDLIVNNAPHNRFTRSLVDFIAIHEVCGHMAHLETLKSVEEIQESDPDLLAIAIHTGQDSFLAEGIAQYLSWFLVKNSPIATDFQFLALVEFTLKLGLRQQMIFNIIEKGLPVEEAAKIQHEIFGGDIKQIIKMLNLILGDPLMIATVFNYFSSFSLLSNYHKADTSLVKCFVSEAMRGFYSREGLTSLAKKFFN